MKRRQIGRLLALALTVLSLVLAGAGGAWLLSRAGVPGAWACVLGAPAGVVALLGLFCLNRDFRRTSFGLGWTLLREAERIDLAHARRAAGAPGRVRRLGLFTVWTDSADDFAGAFLEAAEAATAEFARLSGLPARLGKPLRVLCFAREAAFVAYARRARWEIGRARGFYFGLLRKRIVLCRELAERVPATLRGTVAHEVVHHLARVSLARWPRPWLSEGLAEVVASRVGPELEGPGARLRSLRAAHARGDLLAGGQLLAVTYRSLRERFKNWSRLADAAYCGLLYAQSGELIRYLADQETEPFAAFLATAARKRHAERRFAECFGLSPDEAMQRCLDQLLDTPLPHYQAPPQASRERIETELVTPLLDPATPPDDRRLAVRSMARAGYPWRADALLAILDDPDESLRAEAQRALEALAGELRGPEPAAWRAWLESLPANVVAKAPLPAYDRRPLPKAACPREDATGGNQEATREATGRAGKESGMKKVGCAIGILGLLLFLGSFAFFGTAIVRAMQARKVAEVDLELGKPAATDLVTVDATKACQVAITVDFTTRSVQEERAVGDRDEIEYKLRYSFPFSYRVLDANGKELASEQGQLRWDQGTRVTTSEHVTSSGGSAVKQHNLEKFDVAPPGQIKVEATVQPDDEYGAEAQAVTLAVYDNVSRHGAAVGGGVALLLLALIVGVLGLVLFFIGLARGKKSPPQAPQPHGPEPPVTYEIKE